MKKLFILMIATSLLIASSEITPIPLNIEYDKNKAKLGKGLFFDPILSVDESISCSSCHNLPGNGANQTSYSFGVNGSEGNINSPTVLNARFNFVQFWNGRAKDLKDQALGPITNPMEMADIIENVLNKLNNSKYKKEFESIYKEGVTKDNLADAIAEFEKALITPNSRFDRYLRGEINAINEQEKRGYETFKDLGCISCHNGIGVGGNMYQRIGIIEPYKQDKDLKGRFEITHRDRDVNVYKVPSLRNIELTAPYFHDGQSQTLKDAVRKMQVLQLGIRPKKNYTSDIEAFLKTLTGDSPAILEGLK